MSRLTRTFFCTLSLLLCILLLPNLALAQNPDLSGTWVYNQELSQQPETGGRGMRRGTPSDMTIKKDGENILIETTRPTREGGQQTSTQTIIPDGKAHETEGRMGPESSTATWKEGTLVVESSRTFSRGDQPMTMTTVVTYKLSDDGKQLTATTSMNTPQGAMTTKAVYDKKG